MAGKSLEERKREAAERFRRRLEFVEKVGRLREMRREKNERVAEKRRKTREWNKLWQIAKEVCENVEREGS